MPFARYVLENAGQLRVPVPALPDPEGWRGERPQEGRYREFTQADIDVVDRDTLPFHYEVELPLVVLEALAAAADPAGRLQVNNRKLCEGFYRGIGADDPATCCGPSTSSTRSGPTRSCELLVRGAGSSRRRRRGACLALAEISAPDASFADAVRALGVSDPLLDEGLAELVRVVEAGAEHAPGLLVADLKIARGLDYYTGTVYETFMAGHENLGSVCSGGRYDALASDGRRRLPGRRHLDRRLAHPRPAVQDRRGHRIAFGADLRAGRRHRRGDRRPSDRVAAAPARRGIPTEVAPAAAKFGKQIRYAERRGIPFVWFPGDATRSRTSAPASRCRPTRRAGPRPSDRPASPEPFTPAEA